MIRYKLETIPVWDGIQSGSECFLCDLAKEAEDHAVSFFLGPSVMNPETRVKVNETGFCHRHFHMLEEANKPQGLALMCDTFLQRTREILKSDFDSILNAKPGRKLDKAIVQLGEDIDRRHTGCLMCDKIQDRMVRYVYTVVAMWDTDAEFRKAFEASKGFCLVHYEDLLKMSGEVLDSRKRVEFARSLTELELKNLDRVAADNYWMTQKYKSENNDKPWNGCEDAQKRTVKKMLGYK